MTASVRILSTSSIDSSPSILFIAPDGSKVLVNCGEGCQRLFLEHSQRIATVKAVCLTHLGNESIGGLPGMILTAADTVNVAALSASIASASKNKSERKQNVMETNSILSIPSQPQHKQLQQRKQQEQEQQEQHEQRNLDILGPDGTRNFIHSLRHFMRRDKFQINIHEGSIENFSSSNRPQKKKMKKNSSGMDDDRNFFSIHSIAYNDDHVANVDCADSDDRKRNNSDYSSMIHTTKNCKQFVSFIIRTPPVQGKFLVDKAVELGVPKGSLYGQLKSGKSVSFIGPDGTEKIVESYEVVTPPSLSVSVAVLYYPTTSIADQVFISRWNQLQYALRASTLDLVIHMTTPNLFAQYGVSKWTGTDFSNAEHLLLRTDVNCNEGTPFQSAAVGATSRAYICNEIYLRPNLSTPSLESTNTSTGNDIEEFPIAKTMMEYNLLPRTRKGYQNDPNVQLPESESIIMNCVKQTGALIVSEDVFKCQKYQSINIGHEADLIFTGTGSAIPCKHRNVTGIFLRQADGRSILLDVGEGTIGQLVRCHHPDASYDDILNNIKAVWISHPHADHHLGLLRLLHDRTSPEPILLMAPTPIFHFLDEYASIDATIRTSYTPIDCKFLMNDQPGFQQELRFKLGIGSCRAIPVQHCAHAFACILDDTDFGRVVYSGDCRPCNMLVQAAKGADVLIHEATFEDGMESDAALKKHCTVGEALDVARRMDAKCTILTHFSQRYPKIQPIPSQIQGSFPIIFAFDYMCLKPSTLIIASMLTPALRLLYPVIDEKDDMILPTDADNALSIPGLFANPDFL